MKIRLKDKHGAIHLRESGLSFRKFMMGQNDLGTRAHYEIMRKLLKELQPSRIEPRASILS